MQLPVLHRSATTFTARHPELYALDPTGRPSPAVAWLRRPGRPDPLLLVALDRSQLGRPAREFAPRHSHRRGDALLAGHHELLGDPAAVWPGWRRGGLLPSVADAIQPASETVYINGQHRA
ncbi:hypothetical protein ACFZBE_40820 [Streptomyces sp. NPDC008061]|uniref:hypothetical protein n=1 Tax=Streptomyces sp. NPDC008061 TaxID=3364805 RepID=UPI0036E1A2C1